MKKIGLIVLCLTSFFCGSQSFKDVVYEMTHPIPYTYDSNPHALQYDIINNTTLVKRVTTSTYKYVANFNAIDSVSRDSLLLSYEDIRYDSRGNLISFQGKQGYKTYDKRFSYDAKKRLVEVKNRNDEVIETFKYTLKGVKRFKHPNSFSFTSGSKIVYKLNLEGQILQKTSDGGFAEDITRSYDSHGHMIYENDAGTETNVVYTYDEKGRVIHKKFTDAFRSGNSEYFYDNNGYLIKQTDNDGSYSTEYFYEGAFLVKEVYTKYSLKEVEISYEYDNHGNWVKKIVDFGNEDPREDSISIRNIVYN